MRDGIAGPILAAAPTIVRLSASRELAPVALADLVTVIGSKGGAKICIKSNTVSGAHAALINVDNVVYVRDLCSRAGVFVNEKLVREARLFHGDVLRIGRCQFRFSDDAVLRRSREDMRPAAAMLRLRAMDQNIPLRSRTFLIGKRDDADLVLQDPHVSSAHALIVEVHRQRVICDLHSRYGTEVNGQKIREQELASGDRIRISTAELEYESDPTAILAAGSNDGTSSGVLNSLTEQTPKPITIALPPSETPPTRAQLPRSSASRIIADNRGFTRVQNSNNSPKLPVPPSIDAEQEPKLEESDSAIFDNIAPPQAEDESTLADVDQLGLEEEDLFPSEEEVDSTEEEADSEVLLMPEQKPAEPAQLQRVTVTGIDLYAVRPAIQPEFIAQGLVASSMWDTPRKTTPPADPPPVERPPAAPAPVAKVEQQPTTPPATVTQPVYQRTPDLPESLFAKSKAELSLCDPSDPNSSKVASLARRPTKSKHRLLWVLMTFCILLALSAAILILFPAARTAIMGLVDNVLHHTSGAPLNATK